MPKQKSYFYILAAVFVLVLAWGDVAGQSADVPSYFSTFKGNIEEVDPLFDIGEPGRLYARYIQASKGLPGASVFNGANGYLPLASKTRAAVTLGGYRAVSSDEWKREVFIQEFDSTLEGLILGDGISDPFGNGLAGGGGPRMKIKSWREVIELIRE